MLEKVKEALEITLNDPDFDNMLYLKLIAVKCYLTTAGASEETLNSDLGITCISIGVNDLLNQESGKTKFSPAFEMIAKQICR